LPTSRQLARLLVQPISALDALAAAVVAHVEQDPTARAVTQLARRFTALVRASGVGKRTAEGRAAVADLDAWIAEAKACDASAIASFAAGLNGDASAVRAALTEPWSSGQAEGQINRLKLIKRQSYGRAGLDLLRRRMVLAARSTQSEQEPVPRTRGRIPPAHVVMQRLANANASNRLAGALTQLGRLMKTVHILRYIHEAPLRDAFQLQLNRGEFRQILAKSLFFANRGSFRSGDYEEVMNKASCLSLLSNAVLVWNTIHIARIVDQLRAAGHEVRDEDLARVSPLAHAHVIPNGSYFQSPRRGAEAAAEAVMA